MRCLCLIGLAACFSTPDRPGGGGGSGSGDNNLMFMTSATKAGTQVTTVDAADQMCSDAATAAMLPGTYVAWMSFAGTVDARDRLAGHRGWRRVDGEPVVDTVGDLVGGRTFAPPRIDEDGNDAYGDFEYAMTGTDASGRASGTDCSNSSQTRIGRADAAYPAWTDDTFVDCTTSMHVYCFGTDRDAPLVVQRRRPVAFLSTPVALGGSIAVLDARCAMDAFGAGLSGTFLAAVAQVGTSARQRVSAGQSRGWYRIDGAAVATSSSDDFLAPLNVEATGARAGADVFFGASSWNGLGSNNCNNWETTDSSTSTGDSRRSATGAFTGSMLVPCSSTQRVYCFQTD